MEVRYLAATFFCLSFLQVLCEKTAAEHKSSDTKREDPDYDDKVFSAIQNQFPPPPAASQKKKDPIPVPLPLPHVPMMGGGGPQMMSQGSELKYQVAPPPGHPFPQHHRLPSDFIELQRLPPENVPPRDAHKRKPFQPENKRIPVSEHKKIAPQAQENLNNRHPGFHHDLAEHLKAVSEDQILIHEFASQELMHRGPQGYQGPPPPPPGIHLPPPGSRPPPPPPPKRTPNASVNPNRQIDPNHVQPVYEGTVNHQQQVQQQVQQQIQQQAQYGGQQDPRNHQFSGFSNLPGAEAWPLPQPEMPQITNIDVKCEKNMMKVGIDFDKPFTGIIFSKGHYNFGSCVHLPAGSGRTSVFFDISINGCGTIGNSQSGQFGHAANAGTGSFFENTIVVQYDPQVQEAWDQARKLRCTWHDQYEKAVTFRPFPVDMLDVVRADFAGDNVGCWMQVQVGKGPWASEVAGIVKIGQTMTLVLAIKDEENKFDMMIRNCIAHDGHRAPIELVDSSGCIVRPKLMSRFTKIKNFGSSASVLSYAHFQAFKFPDSMEVHFQCTIQICRFQCQEQCGQGEYQHDAGRPRVERDIQEMTEIGLNRIIRVVAAGDLAFSPQTNDTNVPPVYARQHVVSGVICMSTPGFAATLVVLLAILIISCLITTFFCLRFRSDAPSFPYEMPTMKKR